MTLSQKQRIFTFNIGKLIAYAYTIGFEFSFGEAHRPPALQEIYFKTGRSKTMKGRHPDRLAVDFNIFFQGVLLFQKQGTAFYVKDLETMRPLGEYWEGLHPDNVWGGDWNRNNVFDESFHDPYHFEMKP